MTEDLNINSGSEVIDYTAEFDESSEPSYDFGEEEAHNKQINADNPDSASQSLSGDTVVDRRAFMKGLGMAVAGGLAASAMTPGDASARERTHRESREYIENMKRFLRAFAKASREKFIKGAIALAKDPKRSEIEIDVPREKIRNEKIREAMRDLNITSMVMELREHSMPDGRKRVSVYVGAVVPGRDRPYGYKYHSIYLRPKR